MEEFAGTFEAWDAGGKRLESTDFPLMRALRGERVQGQEVQFRRPDGTIAIVRANSAPILDASGRIEAAITAYYDVTSETRVERQLREESRINETLHRLAASFANELDEEKLLQLITDEATSLTAAKFGSFFFNVKNDKGESYMLYTLYGVPKSAFAGCPMPRNTAVFQPTFDGARVLRLADVTRDPRYGRSPPHHGMPKGHLPVRSYLAVPVTTRTGEVLGGLFFGHPEPDRFTADHERIVVGIAGLAAIALENARLYRTLKASEERAQKAYGDAFEADRRKDEFLAMLGHELRNPLAPIVTALQLMRLRSDEVARRERSIIERQVGHLSRLVDDLLDVSRITQGKIELQRQQTDLVDVIAKAVEIASPLLEQRSHKLSLQIPASGLIVDGDPVRLAQIVANLLTNAAKYTENGGQVTLSARRDGAEIVLRVRDNGTGIEPELLTRIFDLFTQGKRSLDRSQGGLGLGLTLVKSLAALHGGRVSASSAGPGKGSEFTVVLPALAAAEKAPAHSPRPTVVPRSRGQARRVLVVDDNVDAAELLGEALRHRGHEVEIAFDGPGALALLDRFRPDVGLLDIGLPVMDGYELAARLRKDPALAGIRLVAITGYGQAADRSRSTAAGFDEHLVKPIDLDRIVQLVEAAPAAVAAMR